MLALTLSTPAGLPCHWQVSDVGRSQCSWALAYRSGGLTPTVESKGRRAPDRHTPGVFALYPVGLSSRT